MASPPRQVQHHRRLFELLEEQQEPFLLDVYLLENGYSDRAVRPQARVMCSPESACTGLPRLSSHGFRRKRGGVISCILSKFLCQKAIRKALSWEGLAVESGRWSVFGCLFDLGRESHVTEFHRLSSSSAVNEGELSGEIQWKSLEDSNQLSPISVLELHSCEASPIHNHSSSFSSGIETKDASWVGFEELLGSASFLSQHARSKKELDRSYQLLLDCVREVEKRIWDSYECLSPERVKSIIKERIFTWEKQRGDVTDIAQLVDLEVSESREEWKHFQTEVREIGIEMEAVIFEEIREETLLDMLDFPYTSKGL
ncbi:uncharacterized protein [Elaeis guineensis]|uniref:Uncharacterized protein LOC105060062 n=1 Tax=Elaeis guineensis var. tenera TaxID=51953 RepID=A0A6I9SF34_ELAGV|nr:uncharacterized protein LOC105060062 [Elaeis guineensis]